MIFPKNNQSDNEAVHQYFDLTCKKCGSKNVVFSYAKEGGYSEYTQWGSHVVVACNDCHTDLWLQGVSC